VVDGRNRDFLDRAKYAGDVDSEAVRFCARRLR
jgi:hypothetical protein